MYVESDNTEFHETKYGTVPPCIFILIAPSEYRLQLTSCILDIANKESGSWIVKIVSLVHE